MNVRLVACVLMVATACHLTAAVGAGSISLPVSVSNRVVQVHVVPPTNGLMVKLSQNPSFDETTNGVRVTILNLHSNLNYADLNVTYPGGVSGGRGLPFTLPVTTNEVRVLVVPVRLSGGAQVPSYATNGWFQRLMFSETNGPDGRNVPNSVRKFFEQNSYGRVRITGDVYTNWVTVKTPREYTLAPVSQIPEMLVHDTTMAIKAMTPTFFSSNKYDFIITLMPGEFVGVYYNYYEQSSLYWDDPDGIFSGYLNIDLPVEPDSRLLNPLTNEVNTVSNALYVRTAFRAQSVIGVWLAGDTNHTGTNFFTGGSVNFSANLITLGRPVPGTNGVRVDYRVATFYQQYDPLQPFFSASQVSSWYGTFLHEFTHGLGPHITFTGTEYIGDLYFAADFIKDYGLMSGGNHNVALTAAPLWNDPAYLDAYTRFALGLVEPYEVRFGENETNLRLYATEEFPYTAHSKLIKVPLHPAGLQGRRRLRSYDYAGEEYLLIELRKKGAVPGIHNFDVGLPHEGVVIYHVTEADTYTIGAFNRNFVRVIDATPGLPCCFTPDPDPNVNADLSLLLSAAPFGFDSGQFEYVHGAQWQSIGDSNLFFRLDGRGPATVYAKFSDSVMNESPVASATTTFNTWPDSNNNGIDDNWETRYFGSLISAKGAASEDPDQDGMSNLSEFRAGANPTNRLSAITLFLTASNGQVTVHVPSLSEVPYGIEYSRDAGRPRWIPLFDPASPIQGDGTVQEWLDYRRRVGNTRFFRLTVPEH